MRSRKQNEMKLLTFMSDAIQATYKGLQTIDDEVLDQFVEELIARNITIIVDAVAFYYDEVSDADNDIIVVDGKEEIS